MNLQAIRLLVLCASANFMLVSSPTPAHAVAGVINGNVPAIVIGSVLAGAGAVGMPVIGAINFECPHNEKFTSSTEVENCKSVTNKLLAGATASFVIGFIVLDGDNTPEFGHLTRAQAMQAGLTAEEWAQYEENLPELNAIFQDQVAARRAEFEATGVASSAKSKAEWLRAGEFLSPAAVSAVSKIARRSMRASLPSRR